MSRLSGMSASATWNPASVASAVTATTVTVPGAKQGDFAFATIDSWTNALADDAVMTAVVSADNTVTVSLFADATTTDLGSGTVRVMVIPFNAMGDFS